MVRQGGHPNPHLDPKIKKLNLTDQDKKDLVEFMKACTGDFPQIERDRLPEVTNGVTAVAHLQPALGLASWVCACRDRHRAKCFGAS